MIVWELCFSLFSFRERGKMGFVSRHQYLLRGLFHRPMPCISKGNACLSHRDLHPGDRGSSFSSVGTTAQWGWQAPAPGWPLESPQRTLILLPAHSSTHSVLHQALPGTPFSWFFAGSDAGRSSQTVLGQCAHATQQRNAPKRFCFPDSEQLH